MTNDPSFDKRLDAAQMREQQIAKQEAESTDRAASMSGLATGMRIGLEFVAGTLVGVAMGWGLDRLLGTTPWLLLLFTILGFAAGFLNVYRSMMQIEEGIGINRQNGLTKGPKTPKN